MGGSPLPRSLRKSVESADDYQSGSKQPHSKASRSFTLNLMPVALKSRARVTRSLRDREDSCRIYSSKPVSLSGLYFGLIITQTHPRIDQRNPLPLRMNDGRVKIDLRDSWGGLGQRA